MGWGIGALALVAAISSFGLQSRLIWDDLALINEIDAPTGVGSLVEVFASDFFARGTSTSDAHYYRPLVNSSYLVGALLWDRDPFYYSVSNLLFHILACGLLFALLLRFRAPPIMAATGTALFGLMPRLTESVFWISGRTDILATVFVLAALLAYESKDRQHGRRTAAGVLLFLGLLCKEVAVAGLIGLTFLELARTLHDSRSASSSRRRFRELAIRIAPLWAALILYLGVRVSALSGLWHSSLSLDLQSRMGLAAEALGRYALMLFDPLQPALRIGSVFAPRQPLVVALGVGVALVGIALLVRLSRRDGHDGQLLGLVLAASSLVLVLHLLPFGSDSIAADRFLYMPVVALTLLATLTVARMPRRGQLIAGSCATLFMLAFAMASLERAHQWDDEARLWHHTLRYADPHDAIPHSWMGIALLDRDEPQAALAHFKQALRIETTKPREFRRRTLILELMANVSRTLTAMGRDAEALDAIDQALHFEPDHVGYLLQRARILGRLLRFEDALVSVAEASELGDDTAAIAGLGRELRASAREWRALPEIRPGEPIALRVRRARFFERLGAVAAADHIWRSILARPSVSPLLILEAAKFHTFRADPSQAAALIAQLSTLTDQHREEAELLRAAVELRRQRSVPAQILAAAAALDRASPEPTRRPRFDG